MTRRHLFFILAATAALGALALTAARARDVPKVATGFVASILCSETFVSGLDPDRVFAETTAAMPGAALVSWALDYRRRSHTQGRHGDAARSWPQPCGLSPRALAVTSITAVRSPISRCRRPVSRRRHCLPEIAGPSLVAPATPQLDAALDRRLCRAEQPPFRRTKAVVVLKDGRVDRRALCRGLRHRHPDPRLLRDQIGDLGAGRNSRAPGQARARSARAGRGVARPRRSQACDHARSAAAPHRRPCARQFAGRLRSAPRWSRSTAMKFMEADMAAYAESVRVLRRRRAAHGITMTATTSSCRG